MATPRRRRDDRPVPERAAAVKRARCPVAGEERQQFLKQAQLDFQDFALVGDAEARSTTASSRCGSICDLGSAQLTDHVPTRFVPAAVSARR